MRCFNDKIDLYLEISDAPRAENKMVPAKPWKYSEHLIFSNKKCKSSASAENSRVKVLWYHFFHVWCRIFVSFSLVNSSYGAKQWLLLGPNGAMQRHLDWKYPLTSDLSRFFPQFDRIFFKKALNPISSYQDIWFSVFCWNLFDITAFLFLTLNKFT